MSEGPGPRPRWNDAHRQEHSSEEIDDQFRALMEGLRTTLPGVMVLFSFLLVLPLQPAFAEISGVNRVVYYVAFSSAALSSVLLIAPSVHQRVRGPISGIKRRTWSHVITADKLAITGTASFLVTVVSVVYLVSSLIFTDPVAIGASVMVSLIALWSWFYLPLVAFNRDRRS
jgi:Family of unknown function (DUF6328)